MSELAMWLSHFSCFGTSEDGCITWVDTNTPVFPVIVPPSPGGGFRPGPFGFEYSGPGSENVRKEAQRYVEVANRHGYYDVEPGMFQRRGSWYVVSRVRWITAGNSVRWITPETSVPVVSCEINYDGGCFSVPAPAEAVAWQLGRATRLALGVRHA